MTEPQHSEFSPPESAAPEAERPERERPAVQWPDAPSATGDPLVDRALSLLDGVAESPVPEHGELYAAVHDGLLEALNAEPGLPATPESIPRPEGDS
ncbi:hypothetical protein [Arthrobacter sp. ISL-95]|uniref:hypothetical protein n=1 Tax=Arthrobacter sp. ISL-95 TaxID=2819116 RepID=UPI001BEAA26E|nr:hypothetical protein [Arthrobacter sp. ISL-95]MBT2588117.1 hypothetical protein [Arthrobacter sp. ISL-95]